MCTVNTASVVISIAEKRIVFMSLAEYSKKNFVLYPS